MTKIKAESTVKLHKSQGKTYFYSSVPIHIAIDILGLRRDEKKQKLNWIIDKGEIKVTKA